MSFRSKSYICYCHGLSDNDEDDAISLQPELSERREIDLESLSHYSDIQVGKEDISVSDRFSKYNQNETNSDDTQQILLEMFSGDAYIKKSEPGTCTLLGKAETDILNVS